MKIDAEKMGRCMKCVTTGIFLLFAIGFFGNFLEAEVSSVNTKVARDKKYRLSICTLFKNEARYLQEWIEYHTLIGVDHFYLYNNASQDQSVKVLMPYIKKGLVTLIDWPDRVPIDTDGNAEHWALSTQLPAYGLTVNYKGLQETQWLAFVDVDEYLVPINARKMTEILDRYEGYPGLELTQEFYDASTMNLFPKADLLIGAIELTGKPLQNVKTTIEKVIIRPECQDSFTWPPFKCRFQGDKMPAKLNKNELHINKYVDRSKGNLPFGKRKQRLDVDQRLLTETQISELLEVGFTIEDKDRPIFLFEGELRKKMGLETSWSWQ